jgi:AspT/YidE/YbjL antiporter-like protein
MAPHRRAATCITRGRLAPAWAWALAPGIASAAEAGPGFRADLGLAGGTLDFLGAYPFVLLFLTLALGTALGRLKLGFFALGSTAATLLAGIAVSLWAHVGYAIRYSVPALLTTVFLNLFMFAVGLKVGPQFLAGLRKDGAKGVTVALVVVGLNLAIVLAGVRVFGLGPGLAPGLVSGSMTDTAVVGVATGAVESGTYRPPPGFTAEDVSGNVAAAYAVTYLLSLVAVILLVRYLPRLLGFDATAAARAAFITGQSPIRTGLTKVGLPGAPEGMKKEDPTLAGLLKPLGYMTGQFGKNHLGDRDEMLPTAHGFDEFFGNLYHLSAEEEPENPDYPKDPAFRKRFGPRGVIHSFAGGKIEDTGPLTRKRMETIDEEVTAKALDFMTRAKKANKPFFLWWNSTRMHVFTHLKALAPQHPEWKTEEPFASLLGGDLKAALAGGEPAIAKIVMATRRSATPTATSRCSSGRRPGRAPAWRSSSTTRTPSANGPTTGRPPSDGWTTRSTRRGREAGRWWT